MVAPDFNSMNLEAARAFAKDAYRQVEEAEREMQELVRKCRSAAEWMEQVAMLGACGWSLSDWECVRREGLPLRSVILRAAIAKAGDK